MRTRRKPQAGACRICGCAVVQPTPNQFARVHADDRTGRFWVTGHLYEERGGVIRLVDVVCGPHAYDQDSDRRFGHDKRHPEDIAPLPLGYMQRRGAS